VVFGGWRGIQNKDGQEGTALLVIDKSGQRGILLVIGYKKYVNEGERRRR